VGELLAENIHIINSILEVEQKTVNYEGISALHVTTCYCTCSIHQLTEYWTDTNISRYCLWYGSL
jgi:hypothetical protein